MDQLEIHPFPGNQQDPTLAQLHQVLRQQPHHMISCTAWPEYPYCPSVQFAIAYTCGDLVIHFQVQEQATVAQRANTNEPVCNDSCVELFFMLPGSDEYINLEFNCIGTVLGQRGRSREDRSFLPTSSLDGIRRISSLGDKPIALRQAPVEWDLMAAVPLELLGLAAGNRLAGVECRGNIYKCGDALPVPHYVSWRPIDTPDPDFHRPEYFGQIVFV